MQFDSSWDPVEARGNPAGDPGEPNVARMCLRRKPRIASGEGLDLLWATMWTHNVVGDWNDYLAVATLLLAHGVTPTAPARSRKKPTRHGVPPRSHPLHWISIARGRIDGSEERMIEYARLLLDHGAEIDAEDGETPSTPLGWAARHGRARLVEFLIERGATIDAPRDAPASTPLAWARKRGHGEIVDILRTHGVRD